MNKRLKILRHHIGISQKEFGERLHLSVSQISSYETKARNIPDRTVSNIIKEFNVNPRWIKSGSGPILNDNLIPSLDLENKIKSLSYEDQQFVIKIVNNLYMSSYDSK